MDRVCHANRQRWMPLSVFITWATKQADTDADTDTQRERERERDRDREKERERRNRVKERDIQTEREMEREREKERDREKSRERDRQTDREREREYYTSRIARSAMGPCPCPREIACSLLLNPISSASLVSSAIGAAPDRVKTR